MTATATPLGRRPLGVTALSIFFLAGAIITFTSDVSLLWPGGPLEPMWRINPRAREGFAKSGIDGQFQKSGGNNAANHRGGDSFHNVSASSVRPGRRSKTPRSKVQELFGELFEE